MSEMLGNQFFLARNFKKARDSYEAVLETEPENDFVKKRLIICYTQTGEIDKAFKLFYELVKKDISYITNTDIVADDCPCPELISRFGDVKPNEEFSFDTKLMIGMLWLYCDKAKALEFFDNLYSINKNNLRIAEVRNIIIENLKQLNEHNSQTK